MKKFWIVCCVVSCVVLDCAFFTNVNLYGICPDMTLILSVLLAIYMGGLQSGIITGILGLIIDLILNSVIGITSIAYFTAAIAAGACYKKYYAEYVFVPMAYVLIFEILKQHLLFLVSVLMGSTVNYFSALVEYILPCAIASGLMIVPAHLISRALLLEKGRTGGIQFSKRGEL